MNQSCNCKIITGQYSLADDIGQQMIQTLFGKDAQYRYELYFHWYNLIHELGHAIMMFNNPARPHPAEEEQLVNDFAVAYWRQYGETAKLRQLEEMVTQTLTKFPALTDGDYLEFTKAHWGEDVLQTFEGYGWFQFSSVQNSLSRQRTLEEALGRLCPGILVHQEKRMLSYEIHEEMAEMVVSDAVGILRQWGVTLPKGIPVVLSDDVNCHMFHCEDYDRIRSQVMELYGEINDECM